MKINNFLKTIIVVVVLGLIGVVASKYYVLVPKKSICTQDAKLCPDGSYVSRTGPNCEFASCDGNWNTTTDNGVSFQYPKTLNTQYIDPYDWPPKVQILNQSFISSGNANQMGYSCTEAGSPSDRAGETKRRTIDSRVYCVTQEVGAAAGSTYTQYAYAFGKDDKTVILTFTIRYPQCANYADANKDACEKERETFDLDSIVDRMAQSVKFQ